MNKVTYYMAAMILGFSMSAQAQGARTKFKPAYTQDEVAASNEMSPATQTMSQRAEVLNYRPIPNPFITLEPTVGVISSTFSGIEGTGGASVEAATRYQTGVTVLIGRGMWQLESGLLYSTRGGKLTGVPSTSAYATSTTDMDFQLGYFDIPVIARFAFPHSSKSHGFLRGGVVVGILSSAHAVADATYTSAYGTNKFSASDDVSDYFNSTDFRGVFGVGYDWKFGHRIGFVVQAEIQESLAKINTDKFMTDKDVYNMGLGLSFGLTFKL